MNPTTEARRETSGITSRLVLLYVEHAGGTEAVEQVLERCGLQGRGEELLDESCWFTYAEKIALFEAAEEVLADPRIMIHVGETALDLNAGEGLKLALRALGSPRLVYQNIVRANAKFTGSHSMELLDLGRDHARIRYRDLTSALRYHRLDCQYNRGMLACVPALFGREFAVVGHPICGCEGGDACVYDLRWDGTANEVRSALAAAATGGAAIGLSALLAPALLPAGVAVAVGAAGLTAARAAGRRRARWRQLEAELGDRARVAERVTESLQDLVSELRLEDVLAKITRNAQLAVGGKEFALLIDEEGVPTCQSTSGLPGAVTGVLEGWARSGRTDLREPLTIDDVTLVEELAPLAHEPIHPFGTICAAPLVFRGHRLGVLVALATHARTFLPRDTDLIRSYAAQAAIALANARLYQQLEQLATRDHLTGLLNHREFHEALGRELERCRRYGGRFSVVLFDLDRFKSVNDSRGHTEGDRVLRTVGETLAMSCRSSDLAFRVGGDEFAYVLPETAEEEALVAAARARQAVVALPAQIDLSYGVTVWPRDGSGKDELLARADQCLYGMKRELGNGSRVRSRS